MRAQDYPSPPIYVDLDDVLCRTTMHFLALLEREFGKRILYEEILDFDWWKACGLEEREFRALFRKAHEPDELLGIAPKEDAISVLKQWSRSGQKIVIVTGRPQSALEPTLAWLDRYAVSHEELLMVDKYGRADDPSLSDFEGEAPQALPDLARRQFRFAVEDSLSMARFLAKTLTVPVALLDCPWNRADPGSVLVTRFLDWRSLDRAAADGSL
jgi:uncharacterized HAD superfamily protein